MYQPPPPRPKKTNIVRSRDGCKSCRERRTKCDEKKPTCGTCLRLGRACEPFKPPLQFRVVTPGRGPPASDPSRRVPSVNAPCSVQRRPGSPQIGSLGVIRSLQHTERDVFYSTYWEDRCLPALHPIFHAATRLHGLPALRDAILALSSCNISRIHAEKKPSASLAITGGFSPSMTHQTRCQLYYSSAIRRFTLLTQEDYQGNVALSLTVLVLFGYIEASMGNFDGFYKHVQGLTAFLEQLRERTGDPFFRALLSAWLQSQFLVWWARAYFSNLAVQRQLQPIALPAELEGPGGSLHERRVTVLSIMCESHRLNVKETLKHWQHQPGEEDSGPLREDRLRTGPDELLVVCRRLEAEAKRLDEWCQSLPPAEQPVGAGEPGPATRTLDPMRFASHDAALNFGYCVVARMMQSTPFLRGVASRSGEVLGRECGEAEGWARLLVRIADGVEVRTCVTQNSYTIGFSGLLMAASLRCQDGELGARMERWLRQLRDTQPTEEGAFPIYQALAVVRAVNQLRARGRDAYGLSQPVDDGGGTPKFTGYNSQVITRLMVHGKSRESGELFTETIDFDA